MTAVGPVSASLETELRELARQHGIVVWLDAAGTYTGFADALRERAGSDGFPWPVRCFRGSYLELMLALEDLQDGVGMTPLVVHVPGHNTDSIADTPLFELFRAGRRFERALPTLVREASHGRATSEAVEVYLAGDGVTLEAADAWLAGVEAAASRGEGPDLSPLSAEALVDDLQSGGMLAGRLDEPAVADAVWRRAEVLLGIDASWRRTAASPAELASALARDMVGWALRVEFVYDLRRLPVDEELAALKTLARPAVAACQQLARHMRDRHPAEYARIADDTEPTLDREARAATAADLGRIDTFRFEDRVVLAAALDALGGARFTEARDLAGHRTEDRSFWARHDRGRRAAWHLVALAARLGCVVSDRTGLLDGAHTLADAVERYASGGWEVDAAHRQLEQARGQLPHLELEEVELLRSRLDELRRAYRSWADAVARAFNVLCRAEGFLPAASLQQRTLFDEVVVPLAGDGLTAYFVVDALRFEMGRQLADSIAGSKTADVRVDARLAELPSVTEVGMNALAPVARGGKLTVDARDERILGFRAGSVRVDGPEDRRRAIQERVGGDTCPLLSLEEVLAREVTSLRQAVARANVVVVHCEGIDKAGEKGVGLLAFDAQLQDLRAAWRRLYEAGVQRFVMTADHGFLLHDELTRAARSHGKQTDPQRRHVISAQRREHAGEVTVSARDLGYEGPELYFTFPEDAAPFDRGDRAKDFVHGGNSLQERVIPVITVRHRHVAGAETVGYQVELRAERPVAGMHCVVGTVRAVGQASLSYGGRGRLELTLESAGGEDVQVEVCDLHGADAASAGLLATIDQEFRIYFRLHGDIEERVPVRLRHATRGIEVRPALTTERFQVVLRTRPAIAVETSRPGGARGVVLPASTAPPAADPEWIVSLPDGVRDVFRHLAAHGSVNEAEATRMLGGPRPFRAFSRQIDVYAARAPFVIRVEVSSGSKCYVRGDR